jgi:protoheme IX farnesyltransferase
MFAIVFFWTPPHFWALAIRYRDDYRAAAVPMLPVVVGTRRTMEHIVAYSAVLFGTSLLLIPTGVVGAFYSAVAVALGLLVMAASIWLRNHEDQAIRYFVASNLYLAALFAAIAIDGLL